MACLQVKLCVAISEWYLRVLYKCPDLLYFELLSVNPMKTFKEYKNIVNGKDILNKVPNNIK